MLRKIRYHYMRGNGWRHCLKLQKRIRLVKETSRMLLEDLRLGMSQNVDGVTGEVMKYGDEVSK